MGNSPQVDSQQYHATDNGEEGSIDGLVDELVPEREVEIDAHHYLSCHHDRYHPQTFPVISSHHIAQGWQPCHDAQESHEGKYDKVLHAQRIGLRLALLFALSKHKRLIGIAECLGNHGHNHGHLDTRPIDGQFADGFFLVGIYQGEYHLVCSLIEDACNAQQENGPGIGEHPV